MLDQLPPKELRKRIRSDALRLVAGAVATFVAVSATWILASGYVLLGLAPSIEAFAQWNAWNGILSVFVAAAALFGYLYPRTMELLHSRAKIQQSESEMIHRLSKTAEWRDEDTANHVIRVSRISEILALEAGIPPEQARIIALASQMHDLGKVAIPDNILTKPGPLTEEEFEIVKKHTTVGANILAGGTTDILKTAEEIAHYHHERWDGSGYPEGLSGESIPLSARIVALADVFDALTSKRPYKEAWPVVKAVASIQLCAGTHFDPYLVQCFVRRLPEIVQIVAEYSDEQRISPPMAAEGANANEAA